MFDDNEVVPLRGRAAFVAMSHEAIAAIKALRAGDTTGHASHRRAFMEAQERYRIATGRTVAMNEAAAAGGLVMPEVAAPTPTPEP